MKDPFRFLRTGIFGITFDRTTEICLSVFDKPVHYPASLMKGIRKRKSDSLWLARFDRKFLGYSHIWSTPHVINAILGHYARFWIFWRGSFGACKQRLADWGSGSQARKIASPVLVLNTIIELPRLHIPHLRYLKQEIFFFFYYNLCWLLMW